MDKSYTFDASLPPARVRFSVYFPYNEGAKLKEVYVLHNMYPNMPIALVSALYKMGHAMRPLYTFTATNMTEAVAHVSKFQPANYTVPLTIYQEKN